MSIVGMTDRHDLFKFMQLLYVLIHMWTQNLATQTPPLRIIKEEVLHIKKGLDKIRLSGGGRRGVHQSSD